jgi:hypothetical protein
VCLCIKDILGNANMLIRNLVLLYFSRHGAFVTAFPVLGILENYLTTYPGMRNSLSIVKFTTALELPL